MSATLEEAIRSHLEPEGRVLARESLRDNARATLYFLPLPFVVWGGDYVHYRWFLLEVLVDGSVVKNTTSKPRTFRSYSTALNAFSSLVEEVRLHGTEVLAGCISRLQGDAALTPDDPAVAAVRSARDKPKVAVPSPAPNAETSKPAATTSTPKPSVPKLAAPATSEDARPKRPPAVKLRRRVA